MTQNPSFYLATITKIPTNFSIPFIVAIEADSRELAIDRLYKLYSNDIYSGVGRNMSEAVALNPTNDPDLLCNVKQHKLSV